MPSYKLRHSPKFIIYLCICNYLNAEQLLSLQNNLAQMKMKDDKDFLRVMKKYIDLEVLKNKPFLWQDIWIYNYITYDIKTSKFPKKGLIVKYEQEIIMPQKLVMDAINRMLLQNI